MNYKQMLKIGGVDLGDRSRPPSTDEATTTLRAYALAISTWRQPLALAMATAGVKRRVAKRWASRLIREGLPQEARLTGHHRRCRWMYHAG